MLKKIFVLVLVALSLASARGQQGVQCANLIYGGNHTSQCFSDEFLSEAQKRTAIPTERRFRSVKLSSDELFAYPFVMMTGESRFFLTEKERENLRKYLSSGGFLLASAGCSNKDWDASFRREMRTVFSDNPLEAIGMEHPIFRTVNEIDSIQLPARAAGEGRLEGVTRDGKLVVVYSPHGLNDTANTVGCCCCGGTEINNSLELNVNIFVYALLY